MASPRRQFSTQIALRAIILLSISCAMAAGLVGYARPIVLRTGALPSPRPPYGANKGVPQYRELRIDDGVVSLGSVYIGCDCPSSNSRSLFGFGIVHEVVTEKGIVLEKCVIRIPTWSFAGLCVGSLFLLELCCYMRRRRHGSESLCPSCAYDLTGNQSGVCTECGTPIAWRQEST